MANPRICAAIVHDYIYTLGGKDVTMVGGEQDFSRKQADKLYRDYQIALGISKIKAYTEYYALRLFGGSHWTQA